MKFLYSQGTVTIFKEGEKRLCMFVSEQRDKIPKQQQNILSGRSRHPLRVPLCPENRRRKMGEGFCSSVAGSLHDLQILSGQIDALMMAAVHEHVRAKKGVEKIAGHIVGGVEYIFLRILVQLSVGHFPDRAVKIEVDELHPLADAENGLVLPAEQVQCAKLLQCEQHVGKRDVSDIAIRAFSA